MSQHLGSSRPLFGGGSKNFYATWRQTTLQVSLLLLISWTIPALLARSLRVFTTKELDLKKKQNNPLTKVSIRIAAGPDLIPSRVPKKCADQLASIFTSIFNQIFSQLHQGLKKIHYHPGPEDKQPCLPE